MTVLQSLIAYSIIKIVQDKKKNCDSLNLVVRF